MEDFKKRADFRNIIYDNLPDALEKFSYKLVSDNRNEEGDKRRIFRLIFQGEKRIEVFNDDWRDYTEYFRIRIAGHVVKTLNIDEYAEITAALEDLKSTITKIISKK